MLAFTGAEFVRLPESLDELTVLFESVGAREPRSWAMSQLREGVPQLQRFLFLRQAWRAIVKDGDVAWVDSQIASAQASPDAPFSGLGSALKRAKALGVLPEDLAEIARASQAEFLFQLCYLLDDPRFEEPELQDLHWGLFQVDQDDRPLLPRIGGLHESVIDTDPTGREMRPPVKPSDVAK
jgi:hypothetical protein